MNIASIATHKHLNPNFVGFKSDLSDTNSIIGFNSEKVRLFDTQSDAAQKVIVFFK